MDKEDAEKIIRMLLEKKTSERNAVINGILFGIGFANNERRPNWKLIKKLIEEGEDVTLWIEIEDQFFDINKKIIAECIELLEIIRDKEN